MIEFIIIWILCGFTAGFIANKRGADGCLWAFLGFILGPFGIIMACFSKWKKREGPKYVSWQEKTGQDATCNICHHRMIISTTENGKIARCVTCGNEIVMSSQKRAEKKCPFCAEMIKAEAIICRFCGHDLK